MCVVGNNQKFYNTNGKGQILYYTNVALKFNLKRGGINQSLPPWKFGILQDRTMIVGIDVTHPSPGSVDKAPSVAGIVASIDNRYAQWPASIRPQKSKQEMVDNLDQMVVERLRLWKKHNGGRLPNKILVYRDGVSEGQYETVLKDELPGFQKACEKLYGKLPHPKISIIIVGKRHHTRFYPTSTNDCDHKGNTKNGTVVDRGVTMERGWDFFLQAHTCIQGTARPAHYVVIRDEIGLGADGLEQLVSHPRPCACNSMNTDSGALLRHTIFATCSVEQPKLCRFAHPHIMPICCASEAVAIFRRLLLVIRVVLVPIKGSTGLIQTGPQQEGCIPICKTPCSISRLGLL